MDNLTHTLIGAMVAESAVRLIPAAKTLLPEPTRRRLYMSLMIVGSNLPDIDFLYADFNDSKIDYLLHHRGHTHTIVGALGLGLLMLAPLLAWLRRRGPPCSATDLRCLISLALLAPLLHLAMDGSNNYGVHPFWPLYNAWYYGDTLFIIEPLFWVAAAPLLFLLPTRSARTAIALVLLLAVGLAFGSGFVPRGLALLLALLAAAMLLSGRHWPAPRAALTSIAVGVGIVLLFSLGKLQADTRVRALHASQFPGSMLLDRVLTPMPVNPLCWEAILVQLQNEDYVLRRAMLSLAPGLLPASACPSRNLDTPTTVPLLPVARANHAGLQWHGEVTMARTDVVNVLRESCMARAAARFMRALWVAQGEEGWFIGDLRYDREPGLSFAELDLASERQDCPRLVPGWTAPREDLLD